MARRGKKKSYSIGEFAESLTRELRRYTDDVERAIQAETENIGKQGVKDLKSLSKEKFKSTSKNAYWKGWRMKNYSRKGLASIVIHHGTKPGLPHLLEKGHAKVGGGRVDGRVHIATVDERIAKEYTERVIEIIENGGI